MTLVVAVFLVMVETGNTVLHTESRFETADRATCETMIENGFARTLELYLTAASTRAWDKAFEEALTPIRVKSFVFCE